jgi:DNA repair exonuclease SbcCD ATPase subunit
MQKIILGALAILAAAGWAAAYVFYSESGDVSERLANAEAGRAKLESALDAAKGDLKKQNDSAGSLAEIEEKLGAAEASSIVLEKQLRGKRTELAEVTREIESQKLELSKLERELVAKTTALKSAEQDAEFATREVELLRAEAAELTQTAEHLRKESPAMPDPAAAAAAPAEKMAKLETQPGEAEAPAMDRQSRVERNFKLLDKNGNGEIDEFEFRLNSVRLLGLLDTNDDGFVTRDETLLPPDRFSLFDQDSDGKIVPIEFIEAFRILDRDDKGAITQKDYEDFIESAAK